jgi:hypothetical protein
MGAGREGKYAWSECWRKAEVVAVQIAGEMRRPRFHTCVRNASPEQMSTTKFAIVKYRKVSRTHTLAVPLQPADMVAPGNAVYVKVDDCTTPIAAASTKPNPGGAMRIGCRRRVPLDARQRRLHPSD